MTLRKCTGIAGDVILTAGMYALLIGIFVPLGISGLICACVDACIDAVTSRICLKSKA